MTIESEGVTPEPSEVLADVNEQATPEIEDVAKEGDEPETEKAEAELSDEEFEKLMNDKRYQKRLQDEIDKKETRQKAANRAQSKKIEELVAEINRLKTAKPLDKPKIDDFQTMEEYQDALAEHKAESKYREIQEKEAERQLQESQQAEYAELAKSFQEKEAEVIKADPDYHKNTEVIQEFIDLLPKDQNGKVTDPGFQAFSSYIAKDAENGPALLNHLGKNPEKIEALFGKPPAWIIRKLGQYENELKSVPKAPEPKPLPKPPSGIKGTSRTDKPVDSMSPDELLKSIRS